MAEVKAEVKQKEAPKLSSDLEGKYKFLRLNAPGEFIFKGDKYDLTKMSSKVAEKLVAAGCPYLEAIAPAAKSTETKSTETSATESNKLDAKADAKSTKPA